MATLGAAIIWIIVYLTSLALLLSFPDYMQYPLRVVGSLIFSIVLANLAIWLVKPGLRQGRRGWLATWMRIQRGWWSAIGVALIIAIVWIWLRIIAIWAEFLHVPTWQVMVIGHLATGLGFIWLMRQSPARVNMHTLATEDMINQLMSLRAWTRVTKEFHDLTVKFHEPLREEEYRSRYSTWKEQLRTAFVDDIDADIARLLEDLGPDDVAIFLYWLRDDEEELLGRIAQYVDSAPFVRTVLAPMMTIIWIDEKDAPDWRKLVSDYRLDQQPKEVTRRHIQYTLKYIVEAVLAAFLFFGPLMPVAWVIAGILTIARGHTNPTRAFLVTQRVGLSGTVFNRYQFRTLRTVTPGNVTTDRYGKWLIWTRLDQIPTLWNVIRRDMSLLGPNPIYPAYAIWRLKEGPEVVTKLQLRFAVRPGIIDPAALDALVRPSRFRSGKDTLGIHYEWINAWSLSSDFALIIRAFLLYMSFLLSNGTYSLVTPVDLPPAGRPLITIPFAFLSILDRLDRDEGYETANRPAPGH